MRGYGQSLMVSIVFDLSRADADVSEKGGRYTWIEAIEKRMA